MQKNDHPIIDRICPVCKTEYQAKKGRLKYGRETTCSRKCSYRLRHQIITKGKEYTCIICKSTFFRSPSHLKSEFLFCSRNCHYRGRHLGYVKRIVVHPYNITEETRQKWKQLGMVRRGIWHKPPIQWTCLNCRKRCIINRGNVVKARRFKFCSNKCVGEYQRGKNNPQWKGGYKKYYGRDWFWIRRLARKLDHNTCQRCGILKEKYGRYLDVHHLKPVSSFQNINNANYIENVVTLCHECHMKTENGLIDYQLPKRCINPFMGLNKFLQNGSSLVSESITMKNPVSIGESNNSYRIWLGDSKEQLKKLSNGSIDCIISDPPYGLQKILRL